MIKGRGKCLANLFLEATGAVFYFSLAYYIKTLNKVVTSMYLYETDIYRYYRITLESKKTKMHIQC